MSIFRKCAAAIAALAVLFIGLTAMNPTTVQGKPPDEVVVVNAPDSPVPVAVRGTATIEGTVSIAGTPTVSVSSSASNPVFVRETDSPHKHPHQAAVNVFINDGSIVGDATIPVPAGKRWVIEQVTIDSALPVGQKLRASVLTVESLAQVAHTMVLSSRGTFNFGFGDFDVFEGTHRTSIYANDEVALHLARGASSGQASAYFALSGFLVDP